MNIPALLAAAFLVLHGVVGSYLHSQRPLLGILPPKPTDTAADALSFGDEQYLYRAFVLQIQNAGDTGGRFTRMGDYDMSKVTSWLELLRHLDSKSQHYTLLAAHYFSWTQKTEDLRYLTDFIANDASSEPRAKWYWLTQAVEIARGRLNDLPYALSLAQRVKTMDFVLPLGFMWVMQMEPILLADMGRNDEALKAEAEVVAKYGPRMTHEEMNWSRDFSQKLQFSRGPIVNN
jgi:hypothetical protein